VGERLAEGSVEMAVGGSGVGKGTSVPGDPIVLATTVLTSAVMTMGVDSPVPPLAGSFDGMMIGAHAVRNTTSMVKVVRVFISDSFFLTTYMENILFPRVGYGCPASIYSILSVSLKRLDNQMFLLYYIRNRYIRNRYKLQPGVFL